MREHIYHINKNDNNKLLYNHFNHKCTSKQYIFHILDNMSENKDKLILEDKELFWTKLLMCPYPFGNNDCIKNGNIINITNPLTYKTNRPYFSLKITKNRQRPGHKLKKKANKTNIIQETNKFINTVINNNSIDIIKTTIHTQKESN